MSMVAVIDDEPDQALGTQYALEDSGLATTIIEGNFNNVDDLVERVRGSASFALCDNRLRAHGYATFDGAHAVAELNLRGLPAILLTQYFDIDADSSIRRWRRQIPVVLTRQDLGDTQIVATAFAKVAAEQRGQYSSEREPHRTLVVVHDFGQQDGDPMLDVSIPAWRPNFAVRLPVAAIPEAMRGDIAKADAVFYASVNLGAMAAEDLYFDDFEIAPEPADI